MCAYHISYAWRLEGTLDFDAMNASLRHVVSRHESLRTVFPTDEEGRPFRKVLSKNLPSLSITPVSSDDEMDIAAQIAETPFDLEAGPLCRFQLLQRAADHHVLILVLHHLIADGWSRGIFLHDVAASYRNQLQKEASSAHLSNSQLQKLSYAVFLADQAWNESEAHGQQLEYWRQQLGDLTPLQLPLESQRPATVNFASQTIIKKLPRQLRDSLQHLAQQQHTTLFTVLLTAFKLLLHRYTSNRDIAIGVPVAGRRQEEARELIGFFVNTLVLRTRFSTDPQATFIDWCAAVKSTVANGLENQSVPFAHVVEACSPDRSLHRNPLFELMFQVQSDGYRAQNSSTPEVEFPGLTFSQQHLELAETKFEMSWHLFDRDDDLTIAVEYRTELFSQTRVDQMIEHFEEVLNGITSNSSVLIGDLPLSSPQQKILPLVDNVGQTIRNLEDSFTPFHQAFSQQAKSSPAKTAIQFKDQSLTYAELDQQSNAVAHQLLAYGIQVESTVAICIPRSIELLVALLGVLKSGAAYVPIDISLPLTRRDFLFEDSKCSIVIEGSPMRIRTRISPRGEQAVKSLEPVDRKHSAGDFPQLAGSNGCYVIYTSGSTGIPKGTVISHQGLMHYLNWCIKTYPWQDGWGAPVQSSFGFDATITSMLAPLLAGKTVKMLPESSELQALVESIQTAPSVVKLTPAHLSSIEPILPHDLPAEKLPRALVIGGESLTAGHLRFWQKHYPDVELINEYGPTEAVVGCCIEKVDSKEILIGNVPIGRPITGTQLYLLDEYLNRVPAGITGQLYIAGPSLARGYLNQPALTAEQFIPNPFASQSNGHATVIYRTGDLAFYHPDGKLEYVGRVDDQIQLRGYRVELGEVEAALSRQPWVGKHAVVVRNVAGQPQLVGYIERGYIERGYIERGYSDAVDDAVDDAVFVDQISTALRSELPDYMVPAHFQVMDQIPLTQNGKVNRRMLPPIKLPASIGAVAPRNEREQKLLNVWQEILGQSVIGVEDNFFDLGGDSIRGMQIVAGAKRVGLALTPAQLFENQTIAAQASVAVDAATARLNVEQYPTGEVPLSPRQLEFFQRSSPAPHHFNQGILLRISSVVDAPQLEHALNDIVNYHDAFRLRFEPVESEPENRQSWRQFYQSDNSSRFDLETIDLRDDPKFARSLAAHLANRQTEFDLTAGPLFRAVHFLCDGGENRLFLLAHHLIMDGMSWRILLADLNQVYDQRMANQTIHLPAKTSSFREWIELLIDSKQTIASDETSSIDHETVKLFPINSPLLWGNAETLQVSVEQSHSNRDHDYSLEALLLTALAQTLKQFARATNLVIDLEHHGREMESNLVDLTRTIGWFTSISPLNLTLPDASPRKQLEYVQSRLSALSRRRGDHDLCLLRGGETSSAQISFNYLGTLDLPQNRVFLGLASEPIPTLCSPQQSRSHCIDVISWSTKNRLHVLWRFDQPTHNRDLIQQLANRHLSSLGSLLVTDKDHQSSQVETDVPSADLKKLMSKLAMRNK